MFDEITSWDAELRCSNNLRLTTAKLSGREIERCEYHRFDHAGNPLPLGLESKEKGPEGPLMFLTGGGYIYSVYRGTNNPGPIYSTFGCDEQGECFDPRDTRVDNGDSTHISPRSDRKSPDYSRYQYWKRHPIGK